MNKVLLIAGLAVSLLAMPAKAAQWTQDGVTVICPWAEATRPGDTTAPVYMWIHTDSRGDQQLIDALSEVSEGAEISGYVRVGGVLQRVRFQFLPVAAGRTLRLEPGGYQVLLTGLKTPLAPGPTFAMFLSFDPAAGLEVQVEVVPIGAGPPCGPGVDSAAPAGPPPITILPAPPPRWIPRGSF
jgi:copper(I)-binding protein